MAKQSTQFNLDRAKVIDENFIRRVKADDYPQTHQVLTPTETGLTREAILDIFDSQLLSRHSDLKARALKSKNLGFYTIGSSGHEGMAVIGKVFPYTDMAFLHYRDAAFMLQRAKQVASVDYLQDLMLSYMAAASDPISGGRHKVLGSLELNVPPQTSTIASHLPKAVGAALSINKAARLNIKERKLADDSVVLCSFGDASCNHAVSLTAINTAAWLNYSGVPCPIVFVCEDNGIGISVATPGNWVQDNFSKRPGLNYIKADGLNVLDTYRAAKQAEMIARHKQQPVFLHLSMVRLMGHAGSDVESLYLSEQEIQKNEAQDPLLHMAALIRAQDYLSQEAILNRYQTIAETVELATQQALQAERLQNKAEVMQSIIPPKLTRSVPALPTELERQQKFAGQYKQLKQQRNMAQALNLALTDLMLQYDNMLIFGEDVAQKGGVYHVTSGLQQKFGSRRVFNSILDETAIIGTAIGLAHNGFLPVPEIQFLAYYHNAEDQIRGEAATLPFFSNGRFSNPMLLRIASFAYQKGFGGHFHNDNSLAALLDIPGIIIATPSNAKSAVKLLRTCARLAYQEQRVVIFLEPIALYMMKDLHDIGDQGWLAEYPALREEHPFAEVSCHGESEAYAIITYGNGYYLSCQAEKILREQHQINVKVIDLNWLKPLPDASLLDAVMGINNILIVDECRASGSLSESLTTLLYERLDNTVNIKRVTAADSFIPLGDAWRHLLPSRDDIVNQILRMQDESK